MKISCFALSIFLAFLFVACGENKTPAPFQFPDGEWVDLTYSFDEQTVYWPTAAGFRLDTVSWGETEGGYFYSAFQYCAAEHGGTHLDAPIHFAEGKQSADQIPLERLIGSAVVVDVSEKALSNPDYQIEPTDLEAWEQQNGAIPENAILLFRTGYGQYWPDRVKYMGTDEVGPDAVAKLHFPGIHPDAARWLIQNRQIKAVGLDTPSIDYGQSTLFETHQILFKENIPAFENVANLDELPIKGAWVIALPMKIKGGSGGPLRIVGLKPV